MSELDEIIKKYWGASLVNSEFNELKAELDAYSKKKYLGLLKSMRKDLIEWFNSAFEKGEDGEELRNPNLAQEFADGVIDEAIANIEKS